MSCGSCQNKGQRLVEVPPGYLGGGGCVGLATSEPSEPDAWEVGRVCAVVCVSWVGHPREPKIHTQSVSVKGLKATLFLWGLGHTFGRVPCVDPQVWGWLP